MPAFDRYAVYWLPKGPLSDWGQALLGRDVTTGKVLSRPDVTGLPADIMTLTAEPARYGLHATIKPPFRLAQGAEPAALNAALAKVCAGQADIELDALELRSLDGFLALVPQGDTAALDAMAGAVVAELDSFRAPASDAELARRRAGGLTARQDAHLIRWGYPYVMEDFRFHVTLTGRLPPDQITPTVAALVPHLAPRLPVPVRLGGLALMGQAADGFHRIAHHDFSG